MSFLKKYWVFDMDGTLTCAKHDFPAIKTELGLPLDKDILTGLSFLNPIDREKKNLILEKIELEIVALSHSITQTNNYAVVLAEQDGGRRLPIVIGAYEAQAIAVAMEQVQPSRPLTHDLIKNIFYTFHNPPPSPLPQRPRCRGPRATSAPRAAH